MDKDLSLLKDFNSELDSIVDNALAEDIGSGDITTALLCLDQMEGEGFFTARESIVVAGLEVCGRTFKALDRNIIFEPRVENGDVVESGAEFVMVSGKLAAILAAERVALNFLQRLCGIATLTRRFVEAIGNSSVTLLDTRKTTPGLRFLEKDAVRAGGGCNHRFGLFDGILIKDNHIDSVGGIMRAVDLAKAGRPEGMPIEVEARNEREVMDALESGADIIMLDNMHLSDIKKAVGVISGRAKIEVSGGVDLGNIMSIASTGVDFISCGGITHSARSVDISLRTIPR